VLRAYPPGHLEADDLCFRYEGRRERTLSGVDLRVEEGETVLLLGPSGSGKSTLALCLNGLIPHAVEGRMGGAVRAGDLDTRTAPLGRLAQDVGLVFQDPEAQFVAGKVEDEVAFGLENLCVPAEEMDGRVNEALSEVGMAWARRRQVNTLSGGQKQRVALASVLAMRPKVLVLDEPTANLDPAGTRGFFRTVERLKRTGRHTMVIIEHEVDAFVHLVDRVVVLSAGGRVVADGPPREVFGERADDLAEHGVWMPRVSLLADRLRERGARFGRFPVTLDEACLAFRRLAPDSRPRTDEAVERAAGPETVEVPALEVKDLSFSRGGRRVLDRVSLRVPKGDFLALVGANGAGKTTLALHLAGVLRPPRGTVCVDGIDVCSAPARRRDPAVGYVFQNPEHQFVIDSVWEEVAFGPRIAGLPEAEVVDRVAGILRRIGLSGREAENPFSLSHGEKRRLSIATMLATGRRVLVFDEPTFGQDLRNAEIMARLMDDLNAEGRTILAITHDMAFVAEHARSVAVLLGGRLVYHGPTPGLFGRPELLERAGLGLPPLAELSRRLAAHDHAWAGLLTETDFLKACGPSIIHAPASGGKGA
jgi:energy-coupling factor transport system ATP-binding protein